MRFCKTALCQALTLAGLVIIAPAPLLAAAPQNAAPQNAAPQNDGAPEGSRLEEVRVLGTTTGYALDVNNLPFAVQRFGANDLSASVLYSAVDVLEDKATSITTHAAQNNRLQPDIQYRGFVASPLLGLSQGLSVYQNGVRLNEAFGDTVNWDLMPASSVRKLEIIGGSNPAFGLNSIGGSLRLQTHTGFSKTGGSLAVTAGRFGARDYALQWGGRGNEWGAFVAIDAAEESGWREHSDSEALSVYGALSWRGVASELDLFFNLADSRLKGNGAVPEALLRERRTAVFTHPDQTENRLAMSSLSFRRQFARGRLDVTAFYRDLETVTFNGDGSEYEECGESDGESDEGEVEGASVAYEGFLCGDNDAPILDNNGRWVSERFNAINNRSQRPQESYGMTAQWTHDLTWAGTAHQLAVGVDSFRGDTRFRSTTEFAELTASRGTTTTNLFDADGDTLLNTERETWSIFLADHIEISPSLDAQAALRYHRTRVRGRDPSGQRPALEGNHRFEDVNASLGVLWRGGEAWSLYLNGQTAVRTPTPVELACSHPEAPCRLPNAFLADPPLDATEALSVELGVRGQLGVVNHYRLGVFSITVEDDIVFQTTGGVSSNQGFFQNATDTRRQGVEFELDIAFDTIQAYVRYSYLDATFEKPFFSSSPNNPSATQGVLSVNAGDRIPLSPRHNFKTGLLWQFAKRWNIGVDYRYQSGVHLRGDEANIDSPTRSAGVMDFHLRADINKHLFTELRLENAFDARYETFGLYGEADEVIENIDDETGRFLGPAAPRMWWLTLGVTW